MIKDFHLQVGDKVQHIKDPHWIGVITEIDDNLIEAYGVTTCRVYWHAPNEDLSNINRKDTDIQWTNKLIRIEV